MRTGIAAVLLLASMGIAAQPMGGYGMGPGMMQGQGMGPGMMGPGMMGGGPGMGFGGQGIPNLTAEQRSKIAQIQRDLRRQQFELMEKMHDEGEAGMFYRGGRLDEDAARKAYERIEKLHRQMFENRLAAQKRIDSLLTPQQRQQIGQERGQ